LASPVKLYKLYLFLSILLLLGCSTEKKIYEKLYVKDFKRVETKSLSLTGDNYYLLDKVERSLKRLGFVIKKNSPYVIIMTSHYTINCSNPVMHAIPADVNGYIRLSFFVKNKEIYRVQRDFRSNITGEIVDDLVKMIVKKCIGRVKTLP